MLRKTLALLGAAWLLVAFVVTTVEASAMACPEETAPVAAVPPCHGHGSSAPTSEPEPSSPPCSPLCQLLCHGLAVLAQPAVALPHRVVPALALESTSRTLPLLPDTIDHVPL